MTRDAGRPPAEPDAGTKGDRVIFPRDGGRGGRHGADEPRRSGRRAAEGAEPDEAARRPDEGPYDIADAPTDRQRVDLGSLQIPVVEGVEVRVQANSDGVIQQVVLAHGESALQLGAFAAPRSEGIWDEVRADIRKSLSTDGVTAEEAPGVYGTELRARVRTPEGLTDVRFIGVDGPRWMLRAVYQGRAAADPQAEGPLGECLRGLVVDRGRDAMPVTEALPLRLPKEIADQARAQAEAAGPEAQAAPVNGSDGAGAPSGPYTGSMSIAGRTGGVPAPEVTYGSAAPADEAAPGAPSDRADQAGPDDRGQGGPDAPRRRSSPRPRRAR